ncbi:MAG TPA: FixH family protein [Usitatibacter sp.]|nr:FixH family protein [Usitatibacter sp.]
MASNVSHAWYREPWPWFLMMGPAVVVVAGAATMAVAFRTNDTLVAEDYYREGLGINRTMSREERASDLDIAARALFNEDRRRVRVTLSPLQPAPKSLRLTLQHGARASDDQVIMLGAVAPGLYEGALREPPPGGWQLRLEDGEGTWRILGSWKTHEPGATLGKAP